MQPHLRTPSVPSVRATNPNYRGVYAGAKAHRDGSVQSPLPAALHHLELKLHVFALAQKSEREAARPNWDWQQYRSSNMTVLVWSS